MVDFTTRTPILRKVVDVNISGSKTEIKGLQGERTPGNVSRTSRNTRFLIHQLR